MTGDVRTEDFYESTNQQLIEMKRQEMSRSERDRERKKKRETAKKAIIEAIINSAR